MGTPAAVVLRRSNRTICRTAESKGFRAAAKIGIRLMFLSNRALSRTGCLNVCGNKHQRTKITTKSYTYLSYWRRLATGLARRAIPEAFMDRLRGSPQHPRDPAVSKPSQDSGKWQEYDEEKGGDSCSLADSGRHHFSRHCD